MWEIQVHFSSRTETHYLAPLGVSVAVVGGQLQPKALQREPRRGEKKSSTVPT